MKEFLAGEKKKCPHLITTCDGLGAMAAQGPEENKGRPLIP